MFKFAAIALTPLIALGSAEEAVADAYGKPHPEPEYKPTYQDPSYRQYDSPSYNSQPEYNYDAQYNEYGKPPSEYKPTYDDSKYDPTYGSKPSGYGSKPSGYGKPSSDYKPTYDDSKYDPTYGSKPSGYGSKPSGYGKPSSEYKPKYEPSYEYDSKYDPKYETSGYGKPSSGYGKPSPEYKPDPKYNEPKYHEPKYDEPKYHEPKYHEPKYHEPEYKPHSEYKPDPYVPYPEVTRSDPYYVAPDYQEYTHEAFVVPEDPYDTYKPEKCSDKSVPNSALFLYGKCMDELAPSAMEWINSRCRSANSYGHYASTKEAYENGLCEYYSNKAFLNVMTSCMAAAELRVSFIDKYAKDGKGVWKCKEDEFREQTEKCYAKSAKYYPLGKPNYIEEEFMGMIGADDYASDYKPLKLEGAVLSLCSYMNGDQVSGKGYGEYGFY